MKQIEAKQINKEFDKKQFTINVNMALMLAHVSDGYLARAEEILRDAGKWKLDVKQKMKRAIAEIQKVTEFTDKALNKSEQFFYEDVRFIDELSQLLISHVQDGEAQEKLINYIKEDLNK